MSKKRFDTVHGWIIWPVYTRLRLRYLTKYTHSRVVGLRLEGDLVNC